jgi:hypothetical protein
MAIDLVGPETVTLNQCLHYAQLVNPGNIDLQTLAWLYYEAAKVWPGKPALKFAQMLKETRNYKSMLSQPPYNNLAGIGAISYNYPAPGSKLDPYDRKYKTALQWGSLPRAVDAHSAHWMAYISDIYNQLAADIDPRYSDAYRARAAVKVAHTTDDFSGMWSTNLTYGSEWENLYRKIGGM